MYSREKKGKFFLKLFRSYIAILIMSIAIMSVVIYIAISKKVENQMCNVNLNMLNHTLNSVDNFVLKKIEDSVLEMSYSNEDFRSLVGAEIEGNRTKFNALSQYLERVVGVNPSIRSIYVYFKQSGIIVNNTYFGTLENATNSGKYDLGWIPVFQLEKPNFAWMDTRLAKEVVPIDSKIKQENVITYMRAFPFYGEKKDMIISVNVYESAIQDIIRKITSNSSSEIIVANEKGRIISHAKKDSLYKGLESIIDSEDYQKEVINAQSGYKVRKVHGEKVLISYATSQFTKWKYISVTPVKSIIESWYFIGLILAVIAGCTFLFGLAMSRIYAMKIYDPIKRLTGFAKSYSQEQALKHGNEYSIIENTIKVLDYKVSDLNEKLLKSLPQLKNNTVLNIVYGRYSDEEISKKLDMLNVKLEEPFNRVVVFSIDGYYRLMEQGDMREIGVMELALVDLIEKTMLQEDITILTGETGSNNFICIINYNKVKFFESRLKQVLLDTQKKFSQRYELTVSVGIGNDCSDVGSAYSSYNEAISALKYKLIHGRENIHFASEINYHVIEDKPLRKDIFESLIQSINCAKKEKLDDAINTLRTLFTSGKYSIEFVEHELRHAILSLYELLYGNNDPESSLNKKLYNEFKKVETLEEYGIWIKDIACEIICSNESKRNAGKSDLIGSLIRYMKDNIDSDLSIDQMAEMLHISPSYLSRIFKEETGMTYTDYLIDKKLECSKKLLEEGEKVEDSAKAVGYFSTQYFIKQFKKKYGLTPGVYQVQYRKRLLDGLS